MWRLVGCSSGSDGTEQAVRVVPTSTVAPTALPTSPPVPTPTPSPTTEPTATPEGAQSAEEGVFFETVDVNVVNVQVFVTDKKGNPVTGLGIDDFEVFENKQPVKISNLRSHIVL